MKGAASGETVIQTETLWSQSMTGVAVWADANWKVFLHTLPLAFDLL